jgi:thiamine transport system ATP-binding protein
MLADFDLPMGGTTAILGPSGAGKSTLLAGIAGFLPAQAGRLFWDNQDITDVSPANRPVAVLFQDNNLFPHLTIAQNVGLALSPKLTLNDSQSTQIKSVLNRVGLAGFGARKPAALSGGQQSRAALARVLMQDRPLVLLDEPFGALGPALKDEMLDLCVEVFAETARTVLMVTHDPSDAKRIATSVIGVTSEQVFAPCETAKFFEMLPKGLAEYLG